MVAFLRLVCVVVVVFYSLKEPCAEDILLFVRAESVMFQHALYVLREQPRALIIICA